MIDIYDSQTYDLKLFLDVWKRMDLVPVEYDFLQMLHLAMCLFLSITAINLKWDYVLWKIVY